MLAQEESQTYTARMGRHTFTFTIRRHETGYIAEAQTRHGLLLTHGTDLDDVLQEIKYLLYYYDVDFL